MAAWQAILLSLGALLLAWAALVGALLLAGRRADAAAAATLIPDCLVLVRRLLGDPRLARRHKLLLGGLLLYLALPFDLVPDAIPVAGQLDDALAVALVLRVVATGAGRELIAAHWPGPERTRDLLLRLAR